MLVTADRLTRVLAAQGQPGGPEPGDVRLLIAESHLGAAMFSDVSASSSLENFGVKIEDLMQAWNTQIAIEDADIDAFIGAAGLLEAEFEEAAGEKLARASRTIELNYGDRQVSVKVAQIFHPKLSEHICL